MAQPEAAVGAGRLSLAELYERTAPGAVRLAYLLTGDRSVAEDNTQDAFVGSAGTSPTSVRVGPSSLPAAGGREPREEPLPSPIGGRAFLDRARPATTSPGHEQPLVEREATGFVEAYGALDVERTIAYLADERQRSSVFGWLGAQGGGGALG